MIDALFQQLSTVQSDKQPTPKTVAAASVISPDTFLTFVTGATAVATITPPVQGTHMLALIFTATNGAITNTGNITAGVSPTQNMPVFMVYNPITGKYFAGPIS